MARYFFQIDDGSGQTDQDGQEFANLKTAKCQAVRYAGDLICEDHTFWDRGDWEMRVTDETGLTLFTLVFAGYDAASTGSFSGTKTDQPQVAN